MQRKKPRKGATEYKPEFCDIARKLCEEGASNAELAAHFHINISDILTWQMDHSEFSDACKLGKGRFDAHVERALYTRAVGQTRVVEKVKRHKGEVFIVRYREHVPLDFGAAKTWLCNRRSADWARNPEPPPPDKNAFGKLFPVGEIRVLEPVELPPAGQKKESDAGDINGDEQ